VQSELAAEGSHAITPKPDARIRRREVICMNHPADWARIVLQLLDIVIQVVKLLKGS
jgi:hypothetical protein